MKPLMSPRRVRWIQLGVLATASLRCGTPSTPEALAEGPAATSDGDVTAEPPPADPVPIAPGAVGSGDTSLPAVGGQTGDDSGSIALACDQVTEKRVALDDSSRLGFSANDRIALVLGTHEMPLVWQDPVLDANGDVLDYAPRATSSVQVTVELSGRDARLLERYDSTYDIECEPRLLADARLTLSSADGALAETVDAVLELSQGYDMVGLSASLPVAALGGNYAFEPPELRGRAPSALSFSIAFTRYGQTGTVDQQYGDGGDRTAFTSAAWPDWQTCSYWGWVPANYAGPRPTMSDQLDDVRRLAPVVILGADGERTPAQLEIEALPDSTCHLPAADLASPALEILSVPTQVTLNSDALPGPVQFLQYFVSSFTSDPDQTYSYFGAFGTDCGTNSYYSPQDFVSHCGDWGVDLSGVDSVFLETESAINVRSGYLQINVRGMRAPGCAPSPDGFACSADAPDGGLEVVELGGVRVVLGTP